MKDEPLPKNIKLTPAWSPPLIKGPHPSCDLCCWSYCPDITGDKANPWAVKFKNRQCWRHKQGMPSSGAQDEFSALLAAFGQLARGEPPWLPGAFQNR